MKIFLCKVKKQRGEKIGALGKWVTDSGFTDDIRKAQIFTSIDQIRSRIPLFWTFAIHEFNLNDNESAGYTGTISMDDYAKYTVVGF